MHIWAQTIQTSKTLILAKVGLAKIGLAKVGFRPTILGTPLCHVDFVRAQLRAKMEHRLLLDRVQCAWLILSFCGATRANYYLRTIHPSHDVAIMRVFFKLLDIRGALNLASLPCRLGGVGLQNAVRGAPAAYWSSWADSLHMIRKRHPDVADFITVALSRGEGGPHMEAAARCRGNLVGDDFDPMANRIPASKHGWQQKASRWKTVSWLSRSGQHLHPEQALLRSQQGPMAGLPYTCLPISPETTFQPQEFRVLFLRRLWQPLPMSSFTCRCGRPLDSRGHMVSAVRSDGTARRQCATTSGAALDQSRRRKERTYPELAQPHGRARLVVLGCGGTLVRGVSPILGRTRGDQSQVRAGRS